MALATSVEESAAIVVSQIGGSTKVWYTIDAFAFPHHWRETTTEVTKRWVGLTESAATGYVTSHSADSDATTAVSVRAICDSIILKSYSVERTETTVTVEEVVP
jgi:hypothetical protein